MTNDTEHMKARLREYVEAFNANDAARVAALFADNATVEDPVGTPVKRGRDEIDAFYGHATTVGARLELVAPPRGSHANAATITGYLSSADAKEGALSFLEQRPPTFTGR